MSERLTEKSYGVFKYDLKGFKHKNGEFNDYDAFFAYNMAVKRLGELEDEHESLISEVVRLKNDLNIMLEQEEKRQGFTDAVIDENNKLNIENKRLREALQKCSPLDITTFSENYYCCIFCKRHDDYGHTEDCEYIKLTEW